MQCVCVCAIELVIPINCDLSACSLAWLHSSHMPRFLQPPGPAGRPAAAFGKPLGLRWMVAKSCTSWKRCFIPLFIGFQPSKVVQDFFRPPYYADYYHSHMGFCHVLSCSIFLYRLSIIYKCHWGPCICLNWKLHGFGHSSISNLEHKTYSNQSAPLLMEWHHICQAKTVDGWANGQIAWQKARVALG